MAFVLFFSFWLHPLQQVLDLSTSFQLTQICSSLWLNSIPLYICTTASSIHLSMDPLYNLCFHLLESLIFSQSSMFHQALYLCMYCSFGLECFFLISLSSKAIFRLKYLHQASPPFLPPLSTQVELTTPPLCVSFYFYNLEFFNSILI